MHPSLRRSAAMAIRAAHDAFENFPLQPRERDAVPDHHADRRDFVASHAVELEDDRIVQPAVDAGMLVEVGIDEGAVTGTVSLRVLFDACRYCAGSLAFIVCQPVELLARFTHAVPRSGRLVPEAECLRHLVFAASPAPLHSSTVASWGAKGVARCGGVARREGIEPPSFRLEGGCLIS